MTDHECEQLRERILRSVTVDPESGCWLWRLTCRESGYGQIRVNRRTRSAHRIAYEAFVGPIPEGHDVDHVCHNRDRACAGGPDCKHRRCVNPNHLTPATRLENIRRRGPSSRRGANWRPVSFLIRPGSRAAEALKRWAWKRYGAYSAGWRWS